MYTKDLLKKITDFFYGEINYGENDLGFILRLEEKCLSLTDENPGLYFYLDYTPTGSIYGLIKEYEEEIGTSIHAGPMINKSGIKIYRKYGKLWVETKVGYGAEWNVFHDQ